MKDVTQRFLSESDRAAIEACIRQAELKTRGEIVVMVAPVSYHYPIADLLGATALCIPVAVVLTRLLGEHFWFGPNNLWIFLSIGFPLFFLFREVVQRIHLLKRFFIHDKEMQEEVQEAAAVQFYRKGLYRTREQTGVLIYISVFERKVWVLGDRGINAKISEDYWKGIVDMIVQGIRERRPADGICRAVSRVSGLLEEKFPVGPGDTNELKNLMVEGEGS